MNIFINYKIKLNEFFKTLEKENIIKLPKKFDNFSVEIPKIKTHGDLSTNAPMIFAKENNLNPVDLATIIKKELEGKFKEIIKIEVAKPGFLNFFLYKENPVFNAYFCFNPELPDFSSERVPQFLSKTKPRHLNLSHLGLHNNLEMLFFAILLANKQYHTI